MATKDTIEDLGTRIADLVATCDGGPTFKAELAGLADDLNTLHLTNGAGPGDLDRAYLQILKADSLLNVLGSSTTSELDDAHVSYFCDVASDLLLNSADLVAGAARALSGKEH